VVVVVVVVVPSAAWEATAAPPIRTIVPAQRITDAMSQALPVKALSRVPQSVDLVGQPVVLFAQ
jgi:hypothetical protein